LSSREHTDLRWPKIPAFHWPAKKTFGSCAKMLGSQKPFLSYGPFGNPSNRAVLVERARKEKKRHREQSGKDGEGRARKKKKMEIAFSFPSLDIESNTDKGRLSELRFLGALKNNVKLGCKHHLALNLELSAHESLLAV